MWPHSCFSCLLSGLSGKDSLRMMSNSCSLLFPLFSSLFSLHCSFFPITKCFVGFVVVAWMQIFFCDANYFSFGSDNEELEEVEKEWSVFFSFSQTLLQSTVEMIILLHPMSQLIIQNAFCVACFFSRMMMTWRKNRSLSPTSHLSFSRWFLHLMVKIISPFSREMLWLKENKFNFMWFVSLKPTC